MRIFRLVVLGVLFFTGTVSAEEASPTLSKERVILHTTMGDLVLALYPNVAPEHVERFLKLIRAGAYDSTFVFWVHPGFIVQISDLPNRQVPLTPEQGAALYPVKPEINSVPHRIGVVSMPPDLPDKLESTFIILLADSPHLDGKYVPFGQLVGGEQVLQAISSAELNIQHQPIEPIVIRQAEVLESPEALSGRVLQGPPAAAAASKRDSVLSSPWVIGVLVTIGILGLATFLSAGVLPARVVGCCGLLVVLLVFFLLYAQLVPVAHASKWLGLVLFIATLGVFKLMSFFESPR